MGAPDEKRLVELLDEARTALPGVDPNSVSFEVFARAVGAALDATPDSSLDDLHTKDLYLVLACLAKNEDAIAVLDREIVQPLRPSVERACRNAGMQVDDVMQTTWEKLLAPDDGAAPKLLQYTGRGTLAGWLRVIAVREALQDRRRSERTRARDDAAMLEEGPIEVGMEIALLKKRFGASFRDAVLAAVALLTPEQRTVLRFHTQDGLGIDRIAPLLGVHRATAARRLEKARADALSLTRQLIQEKHGLSASEARSLCVALAAEIDISIGRALVEAP